MENPIVMIIVILAVLAGLILVFFIAERASKGGDAKAKGKSDKPAPAKDIPKPAPKSDTCAEHGRENCTCASAVETNVSILADDITSLISDEKPKKEDKQVASERSRMYSRRARMLDFYEKKYKKYEERSADFNSSFEELAQPVSSNSSIVVEGVEISKDDIKKLTALQGLLERKAADE